MILPHKCGAAMASWYVYPTSKNPVKNYRHTDYSLAFFRRLRFFFSRFFRPFDDFRFFSGTTTTPTGRSGTPTATLLRSQHITYRSAIDECLDTPRRHNRSKYESPCDGHPIASQGAPTYNPFVTSR